MGQASAPGRARRRRSPSAGDGQLEAFRTGSRRARLCIGGRRRRRWADVLVGRGIGLGRRVARAGFGLGPGFGTFSGSGLDSGADVATTAPAATYRRCLVDPGGATVVQSRCASASNRRIDPATAALRDPTAPFIGMRMNASHRRRTAAPRPLPLAPDDDRDGGPRRSVCRAVSGASPSAPTIRTPRPWRSSASPGRSSAGFRAGGARWHRPRP